MRTRFQLSCFRLLADYRRMDGNVITRPRHSYWTLIHTIIGTTSLHGLEYSVPGAFDSLRPNGTVVFFYAANGSKK
jgi:hypothetical protein